MDAENLPGFINPVHGDDKILMIQHIANLKLCSYEIQIYIKIEFILFIFKV